MILDFLRGKAITIPPLDGAFRANSALDEAPVLATLAEADNLCRTARGLLASSGPRLVALADGALPEILEIFSAPITALAATPDGSLAVALDDGTLREGSVPVPLPEGVRCVTALAYGPDGTLWLANGSDRRSASGWATDLMEKTATGSVWSRAPGKGFMKRATGLAWPYGLLPLDDVCLFSESWRHRLILLKDGQMKPVLSDLPGYPARLAPSADGGAWLAIFAPRNRLIEFVLQETRYRREMMDEIPPEFWIAPALSSGRSFLEPLQCGGIRSMGIHKPWAPSRSYGLIVRLGADFAPIRSLHSRANGIRHGTTSVVESGGRLFVAARGGDCILSPRVD